jgi:HIRAN domain
VRSVWNRDVTEPVAARIPVVAGLAYIERVRRQPSSFTATLVAEPDNRYLPNAIAVVAVGEKLGYLAPEVAREYGETIRAGASPLTCPARRASEADHETSGVELLLDFRGLSVVS